MKSIEEEYSNLVKIVDGIAAQFGHRCEVVLHDFSKPFDSTIVYIANGHVSERKIGDCGTNFSLEVLKNDNITKDRYNYSSQTKNGKILKATSIYLRDDNEKVIGSICINFDMTDFILANSILSEFTESDSTCVPNITNQTGNTAEHISSNVNELLDYLLQESLRHINKPVIHMTKEDKIKGLAFLDSKGAFLIKKSSDKIAEFYDISRYTLYSYLDESRKESQETSE